MVFSFDQPCHIITVIGFVRCCPKSSFETVFELQEIPAFHDFRIRDPRYFAILFQALILWFPHLFLNLNTKISYLDITIWYQAIISNTLHALWQVSYGCWVTWSISCWQEYYKSVFFPKAKDEQQNFFFCLSTTEAWTFCKMNALNSLIFTSHQKNREKYSLFHLANFWMIKSNCHVPNTFFWYT